MPINVTTVAGPVVNATGGQEFDIEVTLTPPVVVTVATMGVQGASGSGVDVGPGFAKVGNEIRYAISTLTRA